MTKMKRDELEQRSERLMGLLREYRLCTNDTKKAIREWAERHAEENAAWADSYLHLLEKRGEDEIGEARLEAATASAKVRRMEAGAKMQKVLDVEKTKREELNEALDSFDVRARELMGGDNG